MNYDKLVDYIDELGRLGVIGKEALIDFLHDSGRDGDAFVVEGMAHLADIAEELEMRA